MCIAIISTAHQSYKLIVIDNRDEFIDRPTGVADWWPETNNTVLGGVDLLKEARGTWLGLSKTGKIAVLTNYREFPDPPPAPISRGVIMRKFLTEDVGSTEDFARTIVDTGVARDAGGFNVVCGQMGEKLAIISNRVERGGPIPWIAGDVVQTIALSNAAFGDRSWAKVPLGEELMLATIRRSTQLDETEDQLVNRFLALLSHDTFSRYTRDDGTIWTPEYDPTKSIFLPIFAREVSRPVAEDEARSSQSMGEVRILEPAELTRPGRTKNPLAGIYGTQKQTVVLVDQNDRVRFLQRTLIDNNSMPVDPGKGDVDITFQIER